MAKCFPLYGSDPAKPVKVGGVYPTTLAGTVAGAVLLAMIGGTVLLVATPVIFVLIRRVMRGQRAVAVSEEVAARAKTDLTRAVGPLAYADMAAVASAWRGGVVATGLAYDGEHLYAIEESVAEQIDWAEIRRFRWQIESDQSTEVQINVHTPGSVAVPDFGVARAAQAYRTVLAMRQSGFFLHVADVERPVRQFITSDQQVLQKWYEILTQMKEGRLNVR